MSRYGTDHKQSTRRTIVEASGRRFKLSGIDGSGVATLMKDAGLTNGAFYAHFSSKDELVTTTIADQMAQQRASLGSVAVDRHGVEAFVRFYLSPEHATTAPAAARPQLYSMRSHDAQTQPRAAYTAGLVAMVDDIATVLSPQNPAAARRRTWSTVVLLIGTLQMARALGDAELSDAVLEHGIDTALHLLGLDHAHDGEDHESPG